MARCWSVLPAGSNQIWLQAFEGDWRIVAALNVSEGLGRQCDTIGRQAANLPILQGHFALAALDAEAVTVGFDPQRRQQTPRGVDPDAAAQNGPDLTGQGASNFNHDSYPFWATASDLGIGGGCLD